MSCSPTASKREESVEDHALRLWRRLKGAAEPPPDVFVDAQTLTPGDHLAMQAAAQEFVDSSISKTINLPRDISFEAFKHVYEEAYAQGCKGCTTYRPNDVTGAVLEVKPARAGQRAGAGAGAARAERRRGLHRPAARPARRPAGPDLQDQMAGQRPCDLHHHQRRDAGRPSPAVRDLHQFQEHGALRLDGGADPHDLGGVPPRRRRLLRGRGAEGGVRPARRPVDGGPLRALAAGGDRRRDRAPSDRDRLPGAGRCAAPRRGGRAAACGWPPERARRADGARRRPRPAGPCPNCGAAALTHQEGCDVCLNCGYSRCGS